MATYIPPLWRTNTEVEEYLNEKIAKLEDELKTLSIDASSRRVEAESDAHKAEHDTVVRAVRNVRTSDTLGIDDSKLTNFSAAR
jgi:hypothetical protein